MQFGRHSSPHTIYLHRRTQAHLKVGCRVPRPTSLRQLGCVKIPQWCISSVNVKNHAEIWWIKLYIQQQLYAYTNLYENNPLHFNEIKKNKQLNFLIKLFQAFWPTNKKKSQEGKSNSFRKLNYIKRHIF